MSNSNSNSQLVVSNVGSTKSRAEFVQDVQKWVYVDTQLKRLNEKTKEFREYRHKTSIEICEYIANHNLAETKIEITNGEIKMFDKKEYSPLTFDYIETTLGKIVKDKAQVDYIIKALKENRKITTHKDLRCVFDKPEN